MVTMGVFPFQGNTQMVEPGIETGTSWLVVRNSDHQVTRLVTWGTILFYVFISVIYMFRATSFSSSEGSIVSIHLVYVTRWPFCVQVSLTLRLLMSYIYGAPSKARNANIVYIWTYVWQRWNSLFLFAAQCYNTESMQRGFLCHICV